MKTTGASEHYKFEVVCESGVLSVKIRSIDGMMIIVR